MNKLPVRLRESFCKSFSVLRGCQLDHTLDDVAGILVAGQLFEVSQKDMLNLRLIVFRMSDYVLHDIVPVLTLR